MTLETLIVISDSLKKEYEVKKERFYAEKSRKDHWIQEQIMKLGKISDDYEYELELNKSEDELSQIRMAYNEFLSHRWK